MYIDGAQNKGEIVKKWLFTKRMDYGGRLAVTLKSAIFQRLAAELDYFASANCLEVEVNLLPISNRKRKKCEGYNILEAKNCPTCLWVDQ